MANDRLHIDTAESVTRGVVGELRNAIAAQMKAELTKAFNEDLNRLVKEATERILAVTSHSYRDMASDKFHVHVEVKTEASHE